MKKIYLDNAATAPIDPRVQREVDRGMKICGNPSSFNGAGREAAKELSAERTKVARFLGVHQEEVIFTSSGSEANNLAIYGVAKAIQKFEILNKSKVSNSKPHIITTQIEHPSILEPIKQLEKDGFDITRLTADKER